jgi:hypothetical protein
VIVLEALKVDLRHLIIGSKKGHTGFVRWLDGAREASSLSSRLRSFRIRTLIYLILRLRHVRRARFQRRVLSSASAVSQSLSACDMMMTLVELLLGVQ